jgi:hypothetical protein
VTVSVRPATPDDLAAVAAIDAGDAARRRSDRRGDGLLRGAVRGHRKPGVLRHQIRVEGRPALSPAGAERDGEVGHRSTEVFRLG